MLRRIITYLLSSGLTVLVDFAIFTAATALGAGVPLATALGRAVAAIVNFTVNRKAVFRSDGNVLGQFLKYIALVAASGTASAFAITKAEKIFAVSPVIIKAFAEGVLFFVNYLVQRFFIFKVKQKSVESEEAVHESN